MWTARPYHINRLFSTVCTVQPSSSVSHSTASGLLGFHAFHGFHRLLACRGFQFLQLRFHFANKIFLFCNGCLLFEDLLALRIVFFVEKVDVPNQILQLLCLFCHRGHWRPFFLHWRFLFCHVFLSLLVQVKNGGESESQQLELSRLSRSHAHIHAFSGAEDADICIYIYIYIKRRK